MSLFFFSALLCLSSAPVLLFYISPSASQIIFPPLELKLFGRRLTPRHAGFVHRALIPAELRQQTSI